MSLEDRKQFYETHKGLPVAYSDAVNQPARGGRYGELYVSALLGSKTHLLADEGSYSVAHNATPGTGLAGHAAATTLDDTKPFLLVQNNQSIASGIRLYFDYLRVTVTAAGTNGTNLSWAIKTEAASVQRYSSAGTAITAVNPNNDSATASAAIIKAGAVVATAASAAVRLVASGLVRNVINVIGDTYLWNFGASKADANSLAVAGTAITNIVMNAPPVIIGPQQTMLFHFFSASQSAASSHEFELGYWER